ncbi:MAG: GAF domain-containing protein [Anaerolineales bacterium]|nr:GAF domain-containing protein [Anaerolineales bacterium]
MTHTVGTAVIDIQADDRKAGLSGKAYEFLDRFCDCLSDWSRLEDKFKAALAIFEERLAFDHAGIFLLSGDVCGMPISAHTWPREQIADILQKVDEYFSGNSEAGLEGYSIYPVMREDSIRCAIVFEPFIHPPDEACVRVALRPLARAVRAQVLLQDTRHHSREMSALAKITTILTSTLQFEDILPFVADGIQQMVAAEAAAIYLLDKADGGLVFRHMADREVSVSKLGQTSHFIRECIETREPVVENTVTCTAMRGAGGDLLPGRDIRSMLCIPLIARGTLLGVLEAANKRDGNFNVHDRALLMSLAASAANSIYNARLFQELKVANADLEASHAEVLQSRNVLETLFDAITAEICIIDDQHTLIALNAATAQSAGKPIDAMIGKPCYVELASRSQPCPGCRAVEAAFGFRRKEWQRRSWSEAGEPNIYDMTAYPLHEDRDRKPQAIVFAKDVTEKSRMDAVLVQAEKLAAVGRLATGVAHEISNPLTAMIGNAQLLRRTAADGDQAEALDMMIEAGERARQVIQNLLDLAGDDHCDLTPQDVNASIRTAVMKFQGDRDYELVMDLDPGLPLIPSNREQLESLWRHLIINAGDAIGSEQGVILIRSENSRDAVRVMISEYGRDIPSDDLASLFDPYISISSTTRGQGVGLTICRRIIRLHGGKIHVTSRNGEATTFTVELPIWQQADV